MKQSKLPAYLRKVQDSWIASTFCYCLKVVMIALWNVNCDLEDEMIPEELMTKICIKWEREVKRIFAEELFGIKDEFATADVQLEIRGDEVRRRLNVDDEELIDKYTKAPCRWCVDIDSNCAKRADIRKLIKQVRAMI